MNCAPTKNAAQSAIKQDKLDVFPIFPLVRGKKVVVVGHGDEAAAKVRLLGETSADIQKIHPQNFTAAQLQGAVLVIVVTEDEAQDIHIAATAKAMHIPVNVVDRPHLCDFYVGALVNRAPVAVAITSTGVGPVYARHIRAQIEALLPPAAGRLATLAHSLRDTVGKVIGTAKARRHFWARFFKGAVAQAMLAGDENTARSQAQRLLNGEQQQTGHVYLVGAGPGAEDLLTLRAQRVLQEADVILYDALVPQAVVAMGRRDATRVYVGKRKGNHALSQQQINELLVEKALKGLNVVRLKAGDPLIFGRAGEEMAALQAAQITYSVVPGITAMAAAASSANLPLTLRGVSSSIITVTGHDQNGETLKNWQAQLLSGATLAIYMGKTKGAQIAQKLIKGGVAAHTPAMAVENASQHNERIFTGTLADLPIFAGNESVTGPSLIIIGEAVAHAHIENALPLNQEIVPATAQQQSPITGSTNAVAA
ncbi:siroheme synthase CysG [Polycladidibacter stylochi]|uniref:siroheme synthase CysG n=1 Tax=Polycladidibacter stylochi TaxID=1807766 RepID=UPI00082F5B41|nr:siroheme synthase CysG [Pseudovibrio stylochi]